MNWQDYIAIGVVGGVAGLLLLQAVRRWTGRARPSAGCHSGTCSDCSMHASGGPSDRNFVPLESLKRNGPAPR